MVSSDAHPPQAQEGVRDGSTMAHTHTHQSSSVLGVSSSSASSVVAELVARCIAPIKPAFCLTPSEIQLIKAKTSGNGDSNNDGSGNNAADGDNQQPVVHEKESRRKQKQRAARERQRQKEAGDAEKPVGLKVERNRPHGTLLWDLRGNYYRFHKADETLQSMGISPKFGYKDKPPSKQRPREPTAEAATGEHAQGQGGDDNEAQASKRAKIDDNNTVAVGAIADASPKQPIDFHGKTYLAPLTTVGNLPFRRLCKRLGVDITCSEMAVATNILQGVKQEWALLRRHPEEDMFGAQIAGGYADALARCTDLLVEELGDGLDFIDVNCGCPIDLIVNKGAGSCLLTRPKRLEQIATSMVKVSAGRIPITIKLRMGYQDNANVAHEIVPLAKAWGISAVTLHGRSRAQRYSRCADWDYIRRCSAVSTVPLVGNGDVFDFEDYVSATAGSASVQAGGDGGDGTLADAPVSSVMVARGALVKPWIFTEIKERRRWDISSGERFNLVKDFVKFGFEHWGADERGVETCRRFLLEWLSYTHRYIPVGLLEVQPQRLNWRPPVYRGRDDLETLMSSEKPEDWIELATRAIGKPPPEGFRFTPKHKSSSYEGGKHAAEEGANG